MNFVTGLQTSRRVELKCGPGKTKESFRDECDVKKILAKYIRTGKMDHMRNAALGFADVTGIGSYQDCLAVIANAEEAFNSMPALVRKRFDNDPVQLDLFLRDSANEAEARSLGLLAPVPVPPAPQACPEGGKKDG